MPRAWYRETRGISGENRRRGCRGGSAWGRCIIPPASLATLPFRRNLRSSLIDNVLGPRFGVPGRPEVGELAFKALDLQPERRAAGENQRHGAGRGIGLIEFH